MANDAQADASSFDGSSWPPGTGVVVTSLLVVIMFVGLSVVTFLDIGYVVRLLFPKAELLQQGGVLDDARRFAYEVMAQCSSDMFTVAQVLIGFNVAIWIYAAANSMFRPRYAIAGVCGAVSSLFAILSVVARVLYTLNVAAWMAQAKRLGGSVPSPESLEASLFFRLQSLFLLIATVLVVVEIVNMVWIRVRIAQVAPSN